MGKGIELSFLKSYGTFSVEAEFSFGIGINVILGPSGCGKTTTLRVMCGLERPEKGFMRCCNEIFFDTGKGIFLPPQKRRIGIVFQEDNLLPRLTVRENIEFAAKKSGRRFEVEDLIERFGIGKLQNRYPAELSGGERQRVAIIRAIAYGPRALLMDEPFASLDFKRKLGIIEFIRELRLQIPIVIVTHDPLEALLLADRVFLMDEGRKVAEGGKELVREYFRGVEEIVNSPSPPATS